MIAYFDTSAFVPLFLDEPTSPVCRRVWDHSETVVTTRLLQVEACAALAMAHRLGRCDESEFASAIAEVGNRWQQTSVIEFDESLADQTCALAIHHSLRGYDSVHAAAGLRVAGLPEAVLVSGDRALLDVWSEFGAATWDTRSLDRST